MPKGFTESEKERIINQLRIEGQKLFVTYGIKKVTVDELASAVHIAKGSFYRFFQTKEELFVDIVEDCQQKLWEDILSILNELSNSNVSNKQIMFQFIKAVQQKKESYPVLNTINAETMETLYRKLPQNLIETKMKSYVLRGGIFSQYAIQFNYPMPIIINILERLFAALLLYQDKPNANEVNDILIWAVIEKVVKNND